MALKRELVEGQGLGQQEMEKVMAFVENKEWQLACRKTFEFRHKNGDSWTVGNHPNKWLEESMNFFSTNNGL